MSSSAAITAAGATIARLGEQGYQKTHEKYNVRSRGGDLVIISSDDVRFYVHNSDIMYTSTVLRDMLHACTSEPPEIQLTDADIEHSRILKLLLDLSTHSYEYSILSIIPDDFFHLLDLCSKYGCEEALDTLGMTLFYPRDRTVGDSYDVMHFFYACALDELDTAHALLPFAAQVNWGEMSDAGLIGDISAGACVDPTTMPIFWQNRLPQKYFQALLRANRLRMAQPQGTWEEVADDFKKQVEAQEAAQASTKTIHY